MSVTSHPTMPVPVVYPWPEQKWAKHPKKKCLRCHAWLQGRYWALSLYCWTCLPCGDAVLASGERLA